MKTKYLIRLDDACPYMDGDKWQRMEDILDKYGVKPLVGIIPANADPKTMIEPEDPEFWEKAHRWVDKGWEMALHGFDHVCVTNNGGINPVHRRSEFAGLTYEEQARKIGNGYEVLKGHGIEPSYFFAPSHTFDEVTIKAIKDHTPLRKISDLIATKPYKRDEFTIVPCQMGKLREMPISGYWCACYHPNIMKDEEFVALEGFLKEHQQDFLSFEELPEAGCRSFNDKLLSFAYYTLRRIKG
ncbi:MAG: DUF2334 domain-containing protein [Prevotella sp.]|nr:DUF2334 domain-containing protein [Prevotella sp.]